MDIYISDKSKKDEYIKFVKYWEEKWYPEIIKKLYDFCKEVNGAIVNQDLAESIAEDYVLSDCQYAPISQTLYRESLRFLYKGIIIKHNKTEPTYTKTSLFLCEKRRFFMGRTEKGGKVF